jgi:thiamine transport system permease protein
MKRGRWWMAVPPALFIGWFFLYPVGALLRLSLTQPWSGRLPGGVILFTLGQALASTVLTLLVALPLTAVLSNFDFPGRSLVRAVVTVPFVMPTMVVAAAFLSLGFPASIWTILLAHAFYNLAVVVRTVGTTWSRLDRLPYDSARVLGAGRFTAFRSITLPMLKPSLLAAAAIVFLFSFTSFGVVLVLGGLKYRTIEVEIYRLAVTFLDLPAAGALAIAQLLGVGIVMAVYARAQRGAPAQLVPEVTRLRRPGRRAWLVWAVVGVTLALEVTPLVALVRRSFQGNGAGWRFLAEAGTTAVTPAQAITNSLRFASITVVTALLLGGLAAWVIAGSGRRWSRYLDLTLMLPLGTSAVTVGLGFLVALDRPVDLRTSWLIVPIAHSLIAIPFVVRVTVPALRSIRAELMEAAAVLGASPRRAWRVVELPLVARSLAVGGGFAAAVSLGEFGASTFIARPATMTIPTLLFRLLGRPGSSSYSGAMAMAVILMVVTAAVMLLADRGRVGEMGAF